MSKLIFESSAEPRTLGNLHGAAGHPREPLPPDSLHPARGITGYLLTSQQMHLGKHRTANTFLYCVYAGTLESWTKVMGPIEFLCHVLVFTGKDRNVK